MTWLCALHIYQPPTQRADILKLVSKESYLPLLTYLTKTPYPFVLNITGSLIEQWAEHGYDDLLELVRKLQTKPNITLTNSGVTHALFPLWPAEEMAAQIIQNTAVLQAHISPSFRPKGLYLPECAFSLPLIKTIRSLNFSWTIIDEMSLARPHYRPVVTSDGLTFFVRHRELSRLLATDTKEFVEQLNDIDTTAVIALDGEVFGHFDPKAIKRLDETLQLVGQNLVGPAQLLKEAKPAKLRAGTWETKEADIKRRQPFPLWQDRHNKIHRQTWQHLHHIYRAVKESGSLQTDEWVRRHFNNAMSSCYLWWANRRRTAGPFNMAIWNPDMIVSGLTEAIKAVRSDNNLHKRTKYKLETEHADLLKLVWQTHWRHTG